MEKFYHAVLQVVMFLGEDTRVLLEAKGVEVRGSSYGFSATGNKVKGKVAEGGVVAEGGGKKVLQEAETQLLQIYLGRIQETVAEWVSQRPIFDVCARDTGYEGGGKIQVKWWIQATTENQVKVTVEDILVDTRVRQRQESGRYGKRKGGSEGEIPDSEG